MNNLGKLSALAALLFILTGCGGGSDKTKPGGWVETEDKVVVVKSTAPRPQTKVSIGAPPEVIKKVVPPDEKLPKLATLQVTLPAAWTRSFLDNTNEWHIDKPAQTTPEEDIRPLTRIRVTRSPKQTEPGTAGEYTKFLKKADDENYIWPTISETGNLPDGFYIVGHCRLVQDVTATNLDTGFIMVRTIGGDRIKFKCLRVNDDGTRQEAIEMCKSANFQ